jgi:hypothetical protein
MYDTAITCHADRSKVFLSCTSCHIFVVASSFGVFDVTCELFLFIVISDE